MIGSYSDVRYQRVRELDRHVHSVVDRLHGRPRVLKSASAETGSHELELLLRVSHPSFRSLDSVFEEDGRLHLVLEEVDGQPLDAFVTEHPELADALLRQALRALMHLHHLGYAHGDLKPANLLVEPQGRLRIIDLGLASPLGELPRGGTISFLPPEYHRGAKASAGADLYSLARSFDAARFMGGAAETLRAMGDEDPAGRPSTAAVALLALGDRPLPQDRRGRVEIDLLVALKSPFRSALSQPAGASFVLARRDGCGGRTLGDFIRRGSASRRLAFFSLDAAEAELEAFIKLWASERGALSRRAVEAFGRVASFGASVVVRNLDFTDSEMLDAMAAVVRAAPAFGPSTLFLFDASPPQLARLEEAGAQGMELPRAQLVDVRALVRAHEARHGDGLCAPLLEVCEGRIEHVAEVAAKAAREPELSDSDLLDFGRELGRPPNRSRGVDDVESAIREAVGVGASQRALRLFRELSPSHPLSASLLRLRADALELSGDLTAAHACLAELDDADDRARRCRLLLRLGRLSECIELAQPSVASDAEVALYAVRACLSSGALEQAEKILAEAPMHQGTRRIRLRLAASDIALRQGDARRAITEASMALAETSGRPRLRAETNSRLASAHSLSGDFERARTYHEAALEAAERVGDIAGLVVYVANLATAEHAAGELGAALVRYEEAARLSRRLGRAPIEAVALTNLAGLLQTIGACDDALRTLQSARDVALQSGERLYLAQADLIEAEGWVRRDAEKARSLAERALEGFADCGAARQELEAQLLVAELGEAEAAALFCQHEKARLEESGLGGRALLCRARVAHGFRDYRRAAALAEDSATLAERGHDIELMGRALLFAARCYGQLGSPEAGLFAKRGRAAVERLAEKLPASLQEVFRKHPEREFHATADEHEASASVDRLGEGGRRLLLLMRRILLEPEEHRILETAVDEAVALTRAERAFLLRAQHSEAREVLVARNLDGESIRAGRFSRSVADQVLETGECVITERASVDPTLADARSVLDLGLRSILCVPIRSQGGMIVGVLYLDHRFENARFDVADLELIQALGDVIGLSLENLRLHREARERQRRLEEEQAAVSRENAVAVARVASLEARLGGFAERPASAQSIVGESRELRRALGLAQRVAPSDLSVLITGESGTGKELFARFLHDESARAGGPFVAVNCGALPAGVLESELFGHVKGAFTGARADRLGLFRSAEGGTVFLDEVGEMPLETQARLLRTLQEREVRPVGASRAIGIDVRIVAATNRDLQKLMGEGLFRRDLFHRLAGMKLHLPALRERLDDLPMLVDALLVKIGRERGMHSASLSHDALAALMRQHFEGNVRELEQILRRAIIVSEGESIEVEDLQLPIEAPDRRRAHRELDRSLVQQALAAAGGNRTRAAKALGVSRMTVHRWIKRHNLE